MNIIYLIFISLLLFKTCAPDKAIQNIKYKPVAIEKCTLDTFNVYHYIEPQKYGEHLPVIILLDSGGDGLLSVNKTKSAVSQIPCLVIGSDLVRNNLQGYDQIIDEIIQDAIQKFKIRNDQIFIAGFSGGARMAYEYAKNHSLKGLLMCGAGPRANSFEELPCPVYMITGTSDFNFAETYYNPLRNYRKKQFFTDYFRGSHEWPPDETMRDGFIYLMGKSFREGEDLLNKESNLFCRKTDSLLVINEYYFALKAVEKALLFNPENKRAKKQLQEIRHNNEVVKSIKQIESDIFLESKISQAYTNASLSQDSIWWSTEIKQLTFKIANAKGDKKDHFLRIKGFLGILFYSRLNSLIYSQPVNDQIAHILAAYRMIEPKNPDVYYDYALYEWKLGKDQLSWKYLRIALSLGFKDYLKLENDFPVEITKLLLPAAK
jgi:hypothetical protein